MLFLRTGFRTQRRKLGGRVLIFGGSRPKRIPTLPTLAKKMRPVRVLAFIPWTTNRPLSRTNLLGAVEIVIAFSRDSLLKGTLMAQRESALFTVTPGSLIGLAVIFLLLAAFFALLNGQKVKAFRANAATPGASALAKVNASTRGTT